MGVVGHYAFGCVALLLHTAGLMDAIRLVERLQEDFLQFGSALSGDQATLTLSIGIVQAIESDDAVSVLKRAETALDAADCEGGNQAYYHDGARVAPIATMLETTNSPA